MSESLETVLKEARACRVCAGELPLGPRPIVSAEAQARILIVGQAPGTRVHLSGIPWDDRSGDQLRIWLDVSPETFYDAAKIAIIPMGLCYPGRAASGGDMPPRPECAPLWHDRLLAILPKLELTLLVGGYAQARYLGKRRQRSLTETVRAWHDYLPAFIPIPHPSWRSTGWVRKNPFFIEEVVPELRRRVASLL